jgi:polyisoprenoid-binding protein YceI
MTNTQRTLPRTTLPPGRYRLDPDATIVHFSARKFGLFTIRGTMRLTEGEFMVADHVEGSTLRAVLAADSFKTPMAKRDEHVKSASLLDVATFPTIVFESTEVLPSPAGMAVEGKLTVHGRTKKATLQISDLNEESGTARVRATVQVDRRQFGVTKMRAAASAIVKVEIEAVGTRQGN